MRTMTYTPARVFAALVLVASAAVMLSTTSLWEEASPPRDRTLLGIWLIGAIGSFIYVMGHQPAKAPLRWLVRADIGPLLAGGAALAVLAQRLGWA